MSTNIDISSPSGTLFILGDQNEGMFLPPSHIPNPALQKGAGFFGGRQNEQLRGGKSKEGKSMPFFYNGLGPAKTRFNWMKGRLASPAPSRSTADAQPDQQSQTLAGRHVRDATMADQQSHAHDAGLSISVRR